MSQAANKARAKQIERAERDMKAVEYRRAGYSYWQIAKALGFASHSTAREAVVRAMASVKAENVDELREVEAHRLDIAQAAIWQDVLAGDKTAIQVLMKIQDRRSKLLGLDQPFRVESTVTTYEAGSDIDREVQRLAELLAAAEESVTARVTEPVTAAETVTEPVTEPVTT